MTETTARIRWEPDGCDGFTGYVGTSETRLFEVWQSPCDGGNYTLGEWLLTTALPVTCNRTPHSRNPDEMKAEAERWLTEFASSLGAVFPDKLRAEVQSERDHHDLAAAEFAERGHLTEEARRYARVNALDWVLALIDQAAPSAPGGAGDPTHYQTET